MLTQFEGLFPIVARAFSVNSQGRGVLNASPCGLYRFLFISSQRRDISGSRVLALHTSSTLSYTHRRSRARQKDTTHWVELVEAQREALVAPKAADEIVPASRVVFRLQTGAIFPTCCNENKENRTKSRRSELSQHPPRCGKWVFKIRDLVTTVSPYHY